MPISSAPLRHSGPSMPVGVPASADGIDRNSRTAVIQQALAKALAHDSDSCVLRDFLQLAVLWGFAPSFDQLKTGI